MEKHPVTIRFEQIEFLDKCFMGALLALTLIYTVAWLVCWSRTKKGEPIKKGWPLIVADVIMYLYFACGLVYLWWRYIGAWKGIYH